MQTEAIKRMENPSSKERFAHLTPEEKADLLEEYLAEELNEAAKSTAGPRPMPTTADIESAIEGRTFRRGVGTLFVAPEGNEVKHLPPIPQGHRLEDFFHSRFMGAAKHCLQSANLAMKKGASEEVILACLLHDTVQCLMRVDHGWWAAQIYEPYVSEKVAFAIRYHQALRFYPDEEAGYRYPTLYHVLFGEDYKPEPYIEATYKMVRDHKWYGDARLVTANDLYSFEPNVNPQLEQFADIIGRHFKQPKEGLGYDGSPVAHMWRSIEMPDRCL